jgi:CDGSH-type Zn-finger protein
MDQPHIAANKPAVLNLEAGTYSWCSCGLSKSQPFCDGSHAGSGFGPVEFTLEQASKCGLCQCKHSNKGHICDGSHKQLPGFTIDPEKLK